MYCHDKFLVPQQDIRLPQEVVTGTRFAAAQRGFLQQVVPLIRDLAQEASTSSRTSAATLAGAITPFLPPAEVPPRSSACLQGFGLVFAMVTVAPVGHVACGGLRC